MKSPIAAGFAKWVYRKALLLMALVAAGAVLLVLMARPRIGAAQQRFRITASFYPIYIAALALSQGVEAEVACLADPASGCLHDYQLSPDDMKRLATTDLFVINGAGMESFLDQVRQRLPGLKVVDTSEGLPLLPNLPHDHDHEEEEHNHHDGHDHHLEEFNGHVWTSPARYRQQVERLRNALIQADPLHAEQYRQNADRYLSQIDAMAARLRAAADRLPYRTAVLYHSSLAYLAEELGLTVLATLTTDHESGVSAAMLAEGCEAVRQAGAALLLADTQYGLTDSAFIDLRKAAPQTAVIQVDIGVTGPSRPDGWLLAMEKTARQLEALAQ